MDGWRNRKMDEKGNEYKDGLSMKGYRERVNINAYER